MLYQAHRGVCTECPENTMPAFRKAAEQGYPIIELDPKFTADGVCVLHHDWTVNRTCRAFDGSAFSEPTDIRTLTWEQVRGLDAGLWFSEEFRGTGVPMFREVLAFAKEQGIHIKVDNVFTAFPAHQQKILFDLAEQSGADVGFTCPDPETVKAVAARFPNATIHYDGFVDEAHVLAVKALLKGNDLVVWLPLDCPGTAWCSLPKADEVLCAMVKRHARLGLWILSTPEEQARAKELGADIIETTGALKPPAHDPQAL